MTDARVGWGVLGHSDTAICAIIPSLAASERAALHAVATRRPLRDTPGLRGVALHTGADAFERVLDDPLVDAVYVALPPPLRPEWTRRAAAHGKHVLCEAPLALSAADAAETVAACEARGVVLQETLIHRHSRQQRRVRALIRAGELGDVGLLRITHTENVGGGPPPPDRRGPGSIHCVGIHGIDLACWLFDAVPTSVSATATFLPGTDTDVAAGVALGFPGNRLAVIDCGTGLLPRSSFEVVGSTATATVDRPFSSPPLERARTELRLHITGTHGKHVEVFWDDNQYLQGIDAFSLAARGDRGEVAPAGQALVNAQVAEACVRSAQERLPALVA